MSMKPVEERPILLGLYIRPNRKSPTKGRVFDKFAIAPCLCAGMGGGGNIVPTITKVYETE